MRESIIRVCRYCGKEFVHNNKYYERQFCCKECSTLYNRSKDRRIYKVNDTFLQKESPNKYYLLGLMAADGCVYDKPIIQLGLSGENGKDLIEYIKSFLSCSYPIHLIKPKNSQIQYELWITSKKLHSDFVENGIVPRKTNVFKIPNYILQDEQKLKYFIVGYIDGDGCVGLYHKYTTKEGQGKTLDISLVCSDNMAEQLKSSIYFKNASISKGKGSVWQICFNGRKAIEFGKWLYEDMDESVFRSYKYKNYKNYMDNRYEITPGLRQKELQEQIQKDIDANPLITPKQIREKYGVTERYSAFQKHLWRKHNNITYEETLQKYGYNKIETYEG